MKRDLTILRSSIVTLWSMVLLLLSYPFVGFAQSSSTVRIFVKDASTHEALPYVHIKTLSSPQRVYHTDLSGKVEIPVFSGEELTLRATFVGYHPSMVTLSANQSQQEIYLSPVTLELENVEVLGIKRTMSPTASVQTLGISRLQKGYDQTMAGLLSSLPGMRTLSTGALIEKPIMEGMMGNRILITDNSSRLVGQDWGDDHAPEISIPSYAAVEVIKGAESVRFGANAIGGIIVVNTDITTIDTIPRYDFISSYSTNGHKYGGECVVERTSGFSPRLRYRLGYKYLRSGDYSTAEYRLYNTGAALHSLRMDTRYIHRNLTLNTHVNYYDAQMGIFTGTHVGTLEQLLERFQVGRPPEEFIAPFSYNISEPKQHVQHTTAMLHLQSRSSETSVFDIRYALQLDYRREYDLRTGDKLSVPSFAFHLHSHSLQASYHNFFSPYRSLRYGGSVLWLNNRTDSDTHSVPVIPNYVSQEYGIFSIYEDRWTPKMFFEVGARLDAKSISSKGYDWVGNAYGGRKNYYSLSGSVGLRYDFSPSSHWRSHLGLAWRPPEVNELYAKGIHHGEAIYRKGNINLKTEKALKWTMGYEQKWKKFQLQTNFFAHYIHDYIYSAPEYSYEEGNRSLEVFTTLSGVFPVYCYLAGNGAFIGGDVRLSFEPLKGLLYTLRGEWIRGYNLSTHGYFPHIPSDRYVQSLSYKHKIHSDHTLAIGLEHSYVTKQLRFDPDVDLLPDSPGAYHLLGGQFDYTWNTPRGNTLELFCSGHNLLNILYKDYTNRMRFFAHDKGRDLSLGLRFHW